MSDQFENIALDDAIKRDKFSNSRNKNSKPHQKIQKPGQKRRDSFQKNGKSNPPAQDRPRQQRQNFSGEKKGNFKSGDQSESHPSLLVLNLPSHIKVNELEILFKTFGQIMKINTYWVPKLGKNFNAKIFFSSEESVNKAGDAYEGAELDGHILKVKKEIPSSK